MRLSSTEVKQRGSMGPARMVYTSRRRGLFSRCYALREFRLNTPRQAPHNQKQPSVPHPGHSMKPPDIAPARPLVMRRLEVPDRRRAIGMRFLWLVLVIMRPDSGPVLPGRCVQRVDFIQKYVFKEHRLRKRRTLSPRLQARRPNPISLKCALIVDRILVEH